MADDGWNDWWAKNGRAAADALNARFENDEDYEDRTYRNACEVARNVLLVASPLLRLDPSFGDSVEQNEMAVSNLVRLCDLARRVFIEDEVDRIEIEGARFVLTCFAPCGPAAKYALTACRMALVTLLVTDSSVVFPEMWSYPAPEAWCLALNAYAQLQAISEGDFSPGEGDYWVIPDDNVIGLAAAHRVSDLMRAVGGGETMSNN